ncbi:HesA/MoeB/ThiF family protein [Sphingopyxis panaciterrulae]|nr:ThiF family adenylyltransferase [Sphingopyxis panaciterrulae]
MAAFSAHGAAATVLNDQNDMLILDVEWPLEDRTVNLKVGFSPLHPFFPPTVTAPDINLARHRNPFDGGLCLLVPGAGHWNSKQRVAELIHEQLVKIFDVNRLREEEKWDEAAAVEEQAPDPLANYYFNEAEDHSTVYFARPAVPAQSCGPAEFFINPRAANGSTSAFEAMLRRTKPASGHWLAPLFEPKGWAGNWKQSEGRWVRLKQPMPKDAAGLLAAAEAVIAQQVTANKLLRPLQERGNRDLRITVIIFDDEIAYGPDGTGDGWLFLVERWQGKGAKGHSVALVRSYEVSEEIFARLPVAAALRNKKVLLIGAGAVGSFVAAELVRAGIGELTIVDPDRVEPGNSVRWLLGRIAWGLPKVLALSNFLMTNYPFARVVAWGTRLGEGTTDVDVARSVSPTPVSELRRLIDEADLVVDASASIDCQAAMAHECRRIGTPLVVGYATEGLHGGVVVRLRPGAPACWVCLNEHWSDGGIKVPPRDPSATVIPIGCNSPTFTGGSFDLQEVSMEVVRSAIGLLAPDEYDAGDWDWSALALVRDGRRTLPQWDCGTLAPHPKCSGCGSK